MPTKVARSHNQIGQKIGSKGQRTRQALIEATVRLLTQLGLRDVSVAEVARAASTSTATFYVYFKEVPEVVLAALDNVETTSPTLEALLARDWINYGSGAAEAFVQEYVSLWAKNATIYRVRNMAAEEGDDRFYRSRVAAARPVLEGLAERIANAQANGLVPDDLNPRACAGTLLMMLERLSAVGPMAAAREDAPDFASLKRAAAYTLGSMLGARSQDHVQNRNLAST